MLPVLGGISGETSTTLRGGAAGLVVAEVSMAFRGGCAMGDGWGGKVGMKKAQAEPAPFS